MAYKLMTLEREGFRYSQVFDALASLEFSPAFQRRDRAIYIHEHSRVATFEFRRHYVTRRDSLRLVSGG